MKINLFCDGASINENSVRNMVLLYYPCETFSEKENAATTDSDSLTVRLTRLVDGSLEAEVTLQKDGVGYSSCERETDITEKLDIFGIEKTLVGRAFLKCAERAFGYLPPFGILSGVRPAKLVLPYVDGVNDDCEKLVKVFCGTYLTSEEKARLICTVASREKRLMNDLPKKSASLYVSVPFCPTRCRYCSFVSVSTKRLLSMIPDYVEKVAVELEKLSHLIKRLDIPITSVYFGGGTPSILTEEQSAHLLGTVAKCFDLSHLREFTYEAGRPDTVTDGKLRVLRSFGVDRVSINTQTANDEVLRNVGRMHTFGDYLEAMDKARNVGFKTINTDLIAGLPGESVESFCESVEKVMEVGPENITVHSLSMKRSSEYKTGKSFEFTEETRLASDMLSFAESALSSGGYSPYYIYRQKNTVGNLENVGFSLDGHEGVYNICMMEELHSVFSVGAGAVTKLVSPDGSHIVRLFNHKYPYEYLSDDVRFKSKDTEETAEKFYAEYFGEFQ